MKESYEEELAVHFGLNLYAGVGDDLGVASERGTVRPCDKNEQTVRPCDKNEQTGTSILWWFELTEGRLGQFYVVVLEARKDDPGERNRVVDDNRRATRGSYVASCVEED